GYMSRTLTNQSSRRRLLASTGRIAAGASALSACGTSSNKPATRAAPVSGLITQPDDTTAQAVRGGVYKLSWGQDFLTLDPHTTSAPSRYAVQWAYSKFLSVKPGLKQDPDGEIIGDLAESSEFSPDKLTLTLMLRPDVKFAPIAPVNGRTMTAQDVEYSWK